MRLNNLSPDDESNNTVLVDELIDRVLGTRQRQLSDSNITLETDLCSVSARVDEKKLHSAVNALIDHSLSSMPAGGQLSITLMSNDLHWELEVADSSGVDPVRMMSWSERDEHRASDSPQLPNVVATHIELSDAHEMVTENSGQFQTWNCPQGGTARVMIIPFRERMNQAMDSVSKP